MTWMVSDARQAAAMAARIFKRREPAISSSKCNRSVGPRDRTHFPSMPDDDLRHFPGRRIGAKDDAVKVAHLARGAQREQRRAFVTVVNELQPALAALADATNLVVG